MIERLLDDGTGVICCGRRRDPGRPREQTGGCAGSRPWSTRTARRPCSATAGGGRPALLTDVAAVEMGYGTPSARPIHRASVAELRAMQLPGRIDGSEGRGGLRLRRDDRRARRRSAGSRCRSPPRGDRRDSGVSPPTLNRLETRNPTQLHPCQPLRLVGDPSGDEKTLVGAICQPARRFVRAAS